MSFDWFRMWVDAVDDEKLKLLAFEDRWHYVAILCLKRKGILDAGDDPSMRDRKVGAKLGLADRERDEVRRRLIEVKLIDEDWQPKGWGKRQFVSDADPTAISRKRKQREKERHARVTRDNRDSHAPVTDESRSSHATQTQISDSDTDSEKNSTAAAQPAQRAFPPEFIRFKLTYPARAGSQPWRRALQAINARLAEGDTWAQILAGAERYAAHLVATGKLNSEFVMQAATFVGPDKHYLAEWTLPSAKPRKTFLTAEQAEALERNEARGTA